MRKYNNKSNISGKIIEQSRLEKNMSREELDQKGLNDSITHVDFMIGSEDLNIYGLDAEGNESLVFKQGNWAF